MKPLLILRPQPGADETAGRALALGLAPKIVSLFEVRGTAWSLDPAVPYDAVFITSANSLNFIDNQIERLNAFPILCVGAATADAARRAGLRDVTFGENGATSLADLAAAMGHRHLLWLAGRPSIAISHPDLIFDIKTIYETVDLDIDAPLQCAVKAPVVALAHSPRAAQRFAGRVRTRDHIDLVTISEKAAMAAGPGWASVHWPDAPSDSAMLEIAAPLCRTGETGTSA